MASDVFWILFAFLCGSLPLSFWLGKIFLKVDIRDFGDGNPGGTNVWKAGGKWWGMLAIFLDGLKGLLPTAMAIYIGNVGGWTMVLTALAPLLGHVYTPFLHFQGGKALATTFGVWTGLTLYEVPSVLGISLGVWLMLLRTEGWAVVAGMLSVLVYLLVWHPDRILLGVWMGNFIILVWRYRDYLGKKPKLFQQKPSIGE